MDKNNDSKVQEIRPGMLSRQGTTQPLGMYPELWEKLCAMGLEDPGINNVFHFVHAGYSWVNALAAVLIATTEQKNQYFKELVHKINLTLSAPVMNMSMEQYSQISKLEPHVAADVPGPLIPPQQINPDILDVRPPKYKPIVSLDFDGVIHQYTTPWSRARTISDPPVPGALEFILACLPHFRVAIHSSRSHQFLGIRAMKSWLRKWYLDILDHDVCDIPQPFINFVAERGDSAAPWHVACQDAVSWLLSKGIWFPKEKPPAHISIDDRGYRFEGVFPSPRELLEMVPWNRKKVQSI